jgi:PAS domain S-box-containing protein
MNNWFQGQMDYIFFFYGLAFIGLGVVCYILSKEVNQRLAWVWLAFFGFTHGLNEWLDLVAFTWSDGGWFAACRWAIMTASFLFLVEFGRLSLIRRRGRGPGRWLLVILALGACLGALSGWNGLNATTRYAMGLVGGLGAGWALFGEGRQAAPRSRPWLLAGGVGLFLYGLATGLIVPRAWFWPASAVNYETFANLTGLPIQLVRGVLASWTTVMIVGFFEASWPASDERSHRSRARYMYGIVTSLALILVAGWFFTQFLANVAREQVRKEFVSKGKLIILHLTFELEETEAEVKAMSGSPWIRPVLLSRSPQTTAQANSVLDRYQRRFETSLAFIHDQTGTCIASSNRDAPDSFVGHNYSFRPYFQQSIAGEAGRYFARGVVSKKRGFFASYPVRDPVGKIVGIAVIKTTLARFQQELRENDPGFLIDAGGVIFLGSRPSLDYHGLWPVNPADREGLKAQYGTSDFESVFPQPPKDGAVVKIEGKNYLFYRQAINALATPGWSLALLAPVNLVVFYRFLGIVTAFIVVALTLISTGSNLSIREKANHILASEALFRAMIIAAPEAVCVYDPETRKILDANPYMTQWLGYEPEELVGLEIDKVQVPDSLGPQEECAGEGSEGPHRSPGPRYRKKDGSLVEVECTKANILYGDHIRELVFVRDITARKRAEEALREHLSFLQTLIDTIPSPIFYKNVEGIYLGCNKVLTDFLGLPKEEIIGKSVYDVYSKDLANKYSKMDAALFRQPGVQIYDFSMDRADGARRDINFHKATYSTADGTLAGLVGVMIDITERKQAEESLRDNEQFLTDIFNSIQDGMIILNPDFTIIRVNPVLEKFPFVQPMVGRKCYEILHNRSEPCEDCSARQVIQTGQPAEKILTFKADDGSTIFVEIHAFPLLNRTTGQVDQVIEFARNITGRKRAEEERLRFSKLESLGTLSGGIAHDFNNILTAILGNIGLAMLDGKIEPQVRDRLAQAEQACIRAQALSRQLLTFAKGGAPIKKIVSIANLLKESAILTSSGSKSRDEVSIPEDLWSVEADEGQINQVISNLLINADQAMPEGGIIKIKTENILVEAESNLPISKGKYVKLAIADQGIGISPKYLDKIFDPYFSTKQKGSGLGLATAYSIIKNHSGHIQVESQLGVGTTFYIYLPATDKRVPADEPETGKPTMGQGKVLVMDDEEMVREVLGGMLSLLGYEEDFASDGSQAIEKFVKAKETDQPFAAVILDLTIPGGMGGKEAVKELLKVDPQVKAIVSSGYCDDPIMADFQKYGFVEVIAKPYKVAELGKVLNKVLFRGE